MAVFGGYRCRDLDIPRTEDLGLPPPALYVMQRIWPVPLALALRIQDLFFPEAMRGHAAAAAVRPFLARLYLGKAALRPHNRFFSSENFPLDAARIMQLGLPAQASERYLPGWAWFAVSFAFA